MIGGAVSGILEGVFEKLSLGQLEKMKYFPADTAKNVLGNLAKSVVTNAGEELTTELANTVFDTIFMDELSTYELTVQGYMAQRTSRPQKGPPGFPGGPLLLYLLSRCGLGAWPGRLIR